MMGSTLKALLPIKRVKNARLSFCVMHGRGRDDFICEKAQEVAGWGYVGFALDMYGKNIIGKTKEENAALKKPFIENRQLLAKWIVWIRPN
jgi:dienelactone hydrolase